MRRRSQRQTFEANICTGEPRVYKNAAGITANPADCKVDPRVYLFSARRRARIPAPPIWHEHRGELRTHPEGVCGCGGRDIKPTPAMIAQRLRGEL